MTSFNSYDVILILKLIMLKSFINRRKFFQNYNINVETSSQMASDLAYGAGATFHIGLFSGVALVVNADASLISTTFKGVNNKVSTTGFPAVTQSVDIQQNVGVVNVTGGIRFAF